MTDKRKCPIGSGFKYCPESKECPLWLEFLVSQRMADGDINAPGNIQTKMKGDCTHNWQSHFMYDLLFKTTGLQAATESFRNEVVDGGKSFIMSLAAAGADARRLTGRRDADN